MKLTDQQLLTIGNEINKQLQTYTKSSAKISVCVLWVQRRLIHFTELEIINSYEEVESLRYWLTSGFITGMLAEKHN